MPFDIALSGIRAASTELSVTGNNIANASTNGFKGSRTEFGDVYATSVLGAGSNATGSGVQVQDVKQDFVQGSVAFTERSLDLAINGNGFFVLDQGGEILYTRAGAFGLDDEGIIVSNTGANLQGFSADAEGNISGIAGDIQIQTSNLDPLRTTSVSSLLNLDATSDVLQSVGRQFTSEGNQVGVAEVGLQSATTTIMEGNGFALPVVDPGNPAQNFNFSTNSMRFSISLTGAANNNGVVDLTLNSAAGVPAEIEDFNDLRTLVSVINAQLFSPAGGGAGIDVVAEAVNNNDGTYEIQFSSLIEGESSDIDILADSPTTPLLNSTLFGIDDTLTATSGIPQVSNGYPAQSIDLVDPDGNTITYTSRADASAASIASEMNNLEGLSATAVTNLTITNFSNTSGNMELLVNGVLLTGSNLADLAIEINGLTTTQLPGISAVINGPTMQITSSGGADIEIGIQGDDGDSITVLGGNTASEAQVLEVDTNPNLADPNNPIPTFVNAGANVSTAQTNNIVVGGTLNLIVEEGYRVDNPIPIGTGIFQALGDTSDPANPLFTDVVINDFNPDDQGTYNSATSMTIYDSLGNSHVMTQYFVKQSYNAELPTAADNSPNHWQMHVLIDGRDVGDPSVNARATYDVYFNDDGTLDNNRTPEMLISNWVPVDSTGEINGADGPQNILAGGSTPIPDPPTSSNFVIDLTGTTQFGSDFSVNSIDQSGYATGRLSGISIDDDGVIFARYTNGESLVLAQVALADFPNEEGLQPTGNTMWAENFESGEASISPANTGSLGAVQSGALEESNVDLSAELVNLIIAQRNFQASAKTIETADAVTQTIINLR